MWNMEDQNIFPLKKDTLNGLWSANTDSLLQNVAGERSEGRLSSSRRVVEATRRKTQEMILRLQGRREERARIARELHDTLFQGFFGASMVLQTAVDELPANSPSKSSLSRALQLMYRVIEEGRVALQGLRSPAIASGSLEQALADFRNEFPLTNAQFRILVSGHPVALNQTVQEQIYLIAREALANAFHHSKAKNIEAEIEYMPAKLCLVIRDDGCGMDPQQVQLRQDSHWGLLGMHERTRSIGAHLRVWSRLGLGTEVEISISSGRVRGGKEMRMSSKSKEHQNVESQSTSPPQGEAVKTSTADLPRLEEIRIRAHEIYIEPGGQPDHDQDDWLQAERQLKPKVRPAHAGQ
jgi:signal transduction histidine kinase